MKPVDEANFYNNLILEQEKFEANGGIPPHGPLFQYEAKRRLELERTRFEDGEKIALMGALRICANHNLTMPEWVSSQYIKSYDQVLNCKASSWDTAFGRPYPNKKIGSLYTRRRVRFGLLMRFKAIHNTERKVAIDDLLFGKIADEFSIGKTLVKDFYYEYKKNGEIE